MGARITKEVVEQVKGYINKYPNMPLRDIAKLVDIGTTSVNSIRNGAYDHLLVEECEEISVPKSKTIKSEIPYETYRRLVSCELAISEIIARAKLSVSAEDTLFIDYKFLSSLLERHFPDEFKKRLEELQEEDEWEDESL